MNPKVLALLLGVVAPQEFNDFTGLSEAEAFVKGWQDAKKYYSLDDSEADEMVIEAYAEPDVFFDPAVSTLDITEDMTQLWQDQSCEGAIKRWDHASNSYTTVRQAQEANIQWEDPTFGADPSSLYWNEVLDRNSADQMKIQIQAWKRPTELMHIAPYMFWGRYHKPRVFGVDQGQFKNSWFLASLGAIARNPDNIYMLTKQTEYPKNGIFTLKLYSNGAWHSINIDDRLPVYKPKDDLTYKGMPMKDGFFPYGATVNNYFAWWVPLFEKAFAKFMQNYERTEGGLGYEGLYVLTNAPVKFENFHRMNEQTAWKYLSTYTDMNLPMTVLCCRAYIDPGIQRGQEYIFLKTFEGNGQKFVELRNPSLLWSYNKHQSTNYKVHPHSTDVQPQIPFDRFFKQFHGLYVAYDHYGQQGTPSQEHIMGAKPIQYKVVVPPGQAQQVFITAETYNPRTYPRKIHCFKQPKLNTYLFEQGRRQPLFEGGIIAGPIFHWTQGSVFQPLWPGTFTYEIASYGGANANQGVWISVRMWAEKGGVQFTQIQ